MKDFWQFMQHFVDPEKILKVGGFYFLLFIIFAETGLFFGFFLPGDYLIFLAGLFVATGKVDVNIYIMIIGLIVAAILGNFVGYWFGYKTGRALYQRPDNFFFKKKYLFAAEKYYTDQGPFALIMGRFVPFVRTFAPIFAGIVKFPFQKFVFLNIIGAILWICSLTLSGYFLGISFQKEIEKYLYIIIIGFIIITTIPLMLTFVKKSKSRIQKKNNP